MTEDDMFDGNPSGSITGPTYTTDIPWGPTVCPTCGACPTCGSKRYYYQTPLRGPIYGTTDDSHKCH